MPAITPIVAVQNTVQSTTSTTLVDAACETAALADGVDYCVIFRGNQGGNDTDQVGELALLFGSDVIASCGGEGRGLSRNLDGNQTPGFRLVTGDGSKTLKFQHRCLDASDTNFSGSMRIDAIPLTELVAGEDYFHAGATAATLEVSGIGNTWTDARSQAFDFPGPTQDWLVFFSTEVAVSVSGADADSASARFQIDGVTVGSEYHQEWEDNRDWHGFAIADVVNLAAGSHTLRVQVQNRQAQNRVDARRSNFFAIRKDKFEQVVVTVNEAGVSSFNNATYDDTNAFLQTLFTPHQSEHVLVIGYTVAGYSTTDVSTLELRNVTDGVSLVTDAGEYENDNGFDTGRDQIPTLLLGSENLTTLTERDYRVRYRELGGGTGAVGRNAANNAGIRSVLIVIGLTAVNKPMVTAVDAVHDEWIQSGESGVLISGANFGATQGSGKAELWSDFTGTTKVELPTSLWSDTLLAATFGRGSIAQGRMYLVVTNDDEISSTPQRVVVRDSAPDERFDLVRQSADTADGNQDFTHPDLTALGITPKQATFWIVRATADGRTAGLAVGVGFAVSTTERGTIAWASVNGVPTSDSDRIGHVGACIILLDPTSGSSGTIEAQADFVEWIVGGVRVNWSNAPPSGYQVIVRLGSGTLMGCDIAEVALPGSGTTPVTSPGYDPDLVETFHVGSVINNTAQVFAIPSFGAARCRGPGGTVDQVCASHNVFEDAQTTQIMGAVAYGDRAIVQTTTASVLYQHTIAIQEADRDVGYRIQHQSGTPGTDEVLCLAWLLPGLKLWAGALDAPTSSGLRLISEPEFRCQFFQQLITRVATLGTAEFDADANAMAVGMLTPELSACIGWSGNDGGGQTDSAVTLEDRAVYLRDAGGEIFVADFEEMTPVGPRLNYATADGTQRRFVGWAIEQPERAPTELQHHYPHYQRRAA